uniref:Carboxypeptidase activation peptide domain-containing protein n=1 Tax=Acanthochromis polyacanthus TaxID=80966 RepID=A0A3Q1ETL5_9TELE
MVLFCRHQVLRIIPKDETCSVHSVHDIYVFFQLDFWKEVTHVTTPVDVRVPFHSLQSVKIYLETQDIEYSIMIEDLQVQYETW